ncbi:electron transfer flavoprotein subunit beta/FixA family protein, partial [Cellulomonas endometrii]|uniref:electron transfer flavoprotein subunit beta/FixA family protein n=1 Tax=Cellulomonas endometrii TaxID=3036301 RepID=UPI0024ADEDA2
MGTQPPGRRGAAGRDRRLEPREGRRERARPRRVRARPAARRRDRRGEVVALSGGPAASDTPLARKAALSRGPDRLVLVADDALAGAGSTPTAAVLAAAVRAIGDVDVVLTGPESVDNGDRQVPHTLAGYLGWPGLASVSDVQDADGGLVVQRTTDAGVQVLDVTGPAVLAVAADAVVARVPGMKDILGAAKKPTTVLALADLDVPAPAATATTVATARPAPT